MDEHPQEVMCHEAVDDVDQWGIDGECGRIVCHDRVHGAAIGLVEGLEHGIILVDAAGG